MKITNPQAPITHDELRASTIAFSILASVLCVSLVLGPSETAMPRTWIAVVAASAIFWGLVSLIAFQIFWDIYYQYIYPAWLKRWGPLNIVVYGSIGYGIWLLSGRHSNLGALLFVFIGGIEGVLEHVWGIYKLDVLEKVPWLRGLRIPPVLAFSFVEYIVYWAIVLWIARAIQAWL